MLRNRDGHRRCIVGVIAFGEYVSSIEAAINGDPQEVVAGGDTSDINPLAIERGVVNIGPADGNALVRASVFCGPSGGTYLDRIQEAKSLFVTNDAVPVYDNRGSVQIQQFVEGVALEMIMTVARTVDENWVVGWVAKIKIGRADVRGLYIKSHQLTLAGPSHTPFDESAIVTFDILGTKNNAG